MADAPLQGRKILVSVGGSIAAVKAAAVVTSLRRQDAQVRVAMTPGAQRFITPLALQSLAGHPVFADLFAEPQVSTSDDHGMRHLTFGAWAELHLCMAASASLIARLALGLGDDAVTTTALASTAPLLIAPAMEPAMWAHPATQANVETLMERGARFVGPVSGRLASGADGEGRMADPGEILTALEAMIVR